MALHVYRKALQYFGGPGDKVWLYNIINLEITMKLTDVSYHVSQYFNYIIFIHLKKNVFILFIII